MEPTDVRDDNATDEAADITTDTVDLLEEELRVEEIPIDGMCGVD